MLQIELAYITDDSTDITVTSTQQPVGTTIAAVIAKFKFKPAAVGVFGQLVAADYILQHDDRVEMYQNLFCDPHIARRKRINAEKL